jgi:glutathione S-transferase
MGIVLYHSVESTCAQKVKLVLAEKGLEWEENRLNLRRGDQFSTEYLALNPKGVVPTLIHDDSVFRESTVINEYLDDAFPEPELRPSTPAATAKMRLWVKTFDDDVHPVVGVITYATVLRHQMAEMKSEAELKDHFAKIPDLARRMRQISVHDAGIDAEPAAVALRQLDGVLERLDQQLEGSAWIVGDAFSLADCAAAPYILRLDMLQFSGLWVGRRRNLEDWFQRVSNRPNFKSVVTSQIPKSLTDLFKQFGNQAWPKVEAIVFGA